MERSKTLLVAMLTVSAGAAAFFVAGSAFGQDWYEYKGRLTAGNAYLLPVPHGAEAVELELVPNGEAASTTVALFDPLDSKVAVWKLDEATSKATLASPARGDHVLFVYSLKDAGLALRLSASDATDEDLELKRISVERDDVRIASIGKPTSVSQKFVAIAPREPVFATILYSGSVEGLTATVASERGPVLEVLGETGTAYGPGLYGDVSGAREIFPENLAPGSYTATASADRFEGDLWMTFAYYEREHIKIDMPKLLKGPGRDHDREAPTPPEAPETPESALVEAGVPTVVSVPWDDAELLISLPSEEEEEEDDGDYAADSKQGPMFPSPFWADGYCPDAISVYTPSDELLAVLTADDFEEGSVRLQLVEAGDYVLLVHGGGRHGGGAIEVALADGWVVPETTRIGYAEEKVKLGKLTPFGGDVEATFVLDRAPLGMAWFSRDGGAIGAEGVFESEAGEAVRQSGLVSGGFSSWQRESMVTLENLVTGEYSFRLSNLLGYGEITGVVVFYDREAVEEEESEHDG